MAKKTVINGITFDSTFESSIYVLLKAREDVGEITDLQVQPRFTLETSGVRITHLGNNTVRVYTADFSYYELGSRIMTVVEVKGFMRADASLRISIFKAMYPEHDFVLIKQKPGRRVRKDKGKKRIKKDGKSRT